MATEAQAPFDVAAAKAICEVVKPLIDRIAALLPRWRLHFPNENSEVEIWRSELLELVEAAKHLPAALAEIETLRALPDWLITKLKTLGEYYEPPTDSRDVVHEIYGWMHVLCFHYIQNRREVKEYDSARREAKQLKEQNATLEREREDLRSKLVACQTDLQNAVTTACEDVSKLERERDAARVEVERLKSASESLLAVTCYVDNGHCSICHGYWPNEHREGCQGAKVKAALEGDA